MFENGSYLRRRKRFKKKDAIKDKEEREEQQRQFQKHMADASRGLDYSNFYNNPYAMQNVPVAGAGLMVPNQLGNIQQNIQADHQQIQQPQIQHPENNNADINKTEIVNEGQPPMKRQKVGSGNSDETGVSSKENTSGYISETANKDNMPESDKSLTPSMDIDF